MQCCYYHSRRRRRRHRRCRPRRAPRQPRCRPPPLQGACRDCWKFPGRQCRPPEGWTAPRCAPGASWVSRTFTMYTRQTPFGDSEKVCLLGNKFRQRRVRRGDVEQVREDVHPSGHPGIPPCHVSRRSRSARPRHRRRGSEKLLVLETHLYVGKEL